MPSKEKTLWGIWRDGYGWAEDSEGRLFVYLDQRHIANACRDRLQEEQRPVPALVLRKMAVVGEQNTLWGLWYTGEHGEGWSLDYFGDARFSYERRLVAAYAVALANDGYTYLVKAVGDDGQPVDDGPGELEKALAAADSRLIVRRTALEITEEQTRLAADELAKALADFETAIEPRLATDGERIAEAMALEEDVHFLASDEPALAVHPGLAEMTSNPSEDAKSMRQLTYKFLGLPHSVRVGICHDLGLPMYEETMDGVKQFIPAFRAAKQREQLHALRQCVEAAAHDLTK